jgi:hypothetical protein
VGGLDLQIVVQPFERIERIEPIELFLELWAKKNRRTFDTAV